MSSLRQRHILLGISGGIAAYKGAELVRLLRREGAEVRVMMTRSAREFITPLTLQALSGHPVHGDLLDPGAEAGMGHIELARWADQILIAPASANCIARLAHGLADDLLTTVCLASAAPLLLAPAMNRQMWDAPATRANVAQLQARGVRILGPGTGEQACGEVGPGRLLEPGELVRLLAMNGEPGPLADLRVLITAGPTREAIDPVRYISNRSSGRMGYALAQAAAGAGAEVTLISGPVALAPPPGSRMIPVNSAADMHAAVFSQLAGQDIFIATAAVADYRPAQPATHKIKKAATEMTLTLSRTEDILSAVAARPGAPFTVGFAAETRELERYARDKLRRKGLDLVAANLVGGEGIGFDSPDNALSVFWEGGMLEIPRASKEAVAQRLVALIGERYRDKNRTENH